MPPKKVYNKGGGHTPNQKSAAKITKKYKTCGKRMSPQRREKVRRALYDVSKNNQSIRKAAGENGLSYSFLYRRWTGEVNEYKMKGQPPVFTESEETAMAKWLCEMSQRGMGLRMCEFLDFVQTVVNKEKRQVPFKNGRPGKKWYYAFMNRNSHIINQRVETALELKRSRVTKEKVDAWYDRFRDFLLSIDLIDKPNKIWNADETGFNMGSNKSKVIGPTRRDLGVPHISFGKQRLTVMFCGSASGQMMPPFLVYPEPKPRGYNPLNGSLDGTDIAYTKKGWMDRATFSKFVDHFDRHAGVERPVLLLFDSVSSHVDHDVFMKAKSKGIELYRILPNATHLMQPLDKGVFGPLKSKWHLTSRKYCRENPGKTIGKDNFAIKLSETFLQFYKPLTVINAFKSAGIYPVDSTVITREMLKPSLTYTDDEAANVCIDIEETRTDSQEESGEQEKAKGALEVFQNTLSTPVRQRYAYQIEEGLDLERQSPCFDVYKKLHEKAYPHDRDLKEKSRHTCSTSGLELLADAAVLQLDTKQPVQSYLQEDSDGIGELSDTGDVPMSPVLTESLVYPKATNCSTRTRLSVLDTCPDHLTSPESIRQFSLKQLETVKSFAKKEKKS
ncbi:uncharacterized protein LOC134254888 [Saccostrea cucullata]|uniref:uncharacterized protein LOC134254888 n=1 Tax=Saccostrea cuccullata TaxID=36930 RepID=UPI002ED613A3